MKELLIETTSSFIFDASKIVTPGFVSTIVFCAYLFAIGVIGYAIYQMFK